MATMHWSGVAEDDLTCLLEAGDEEPWQHGECRCSDRSGKDKPCPICNCRKEQPKFLELKKSR